MKIAEKLSTWVKNTEGKGEIARHEQFTLSPSVFKRLVLQTRKGLTNQTLLLNLQNLGEKKTRNVPESGGKYGLGSTLFKFGKKWLE